MKKIIIVVVIVILIAAGVGYYFGNQKIKNYINSQNNNTPEEFDRSPSIVKNPDTDNPRFVVALDSKPTCDLETWALKIVKPSIDQIFNNSKFVNSGSCKNLPLTGAILIAEKLFNKEDVNAVYLKLLGSGLSAGSNPIHNEFTNAEEMTFFTLYGQTPVVVELDMNIEEQLIYIKITNK